MHLGLLTQLLQAWNTMRVRSAQRTEERNLQKKSPERVRQLTSSANLRDQPHDSRTTRHVQGWWTGTFLEPSIQADAAERPEDHRHFESWNRPKRFPDLAVRRSSAPNRYADVGCSLENDSDSEDQAVEGLRALVCV